jgi:hypothetical protein
MSFSEFVRESKKSLVDVYKNQDYPFEVLVDQLNIQRISAATHCLIHVYPSNN